MSATIPLWAIGKHITNILLTTQSVNTSSGALTATTVTYQFYGQTQEVNLSSKFQVENISAQNRPYENSVPLEQGTRLRIVELEKSAGTNLAAACSFNGSVFSYVLTRGAQAFTGWGTMIGYELNASGKGSIKATIDFDPIDIGTDAPIVYN